MIIHAFTWLGATAPDAPLPEPTTPTLNGWKLVQALPNIRMKGTPNPGPVADVQLYWEGESVS